MAKNFGRLYSMLKCVGLVKVFFWEWPELVKHPVGVYRTGQASLVWLGLSGVSVGVAKYV